MNFTSLQFALFLPVVYILYWGVFFRSARLQNLQLLASSILFYISFGWQSIILILFSTLFNFNMGKRIARCHKEGDKRLLLWIGIITNVGLLVFFKSYHLFIPGLSNSFQIAETSKIFHQELLLPLGISFYTFQTIGYLIDIYNEELDACDNMLYFATYLLYFPKIIAGPIEKAETFLTQIKDKRVFNYYLSVDGLRQFLWGFFVKVVIANNCSTLTQPIFSAPGNYSGSTLLMGAFFYLFQVYCDFSGYSNMAIGISKLFGIRLTRNFAAPFFTTNISEYWRKWHISLSSWMFSNVYTPLSFSLRKLNKTGIIVSILLTFLLIGAWHGAKVTFLTFGLLHGLYFIPILIRRQKGKQLGNPQKSIHPINRVSKMLGLFFLVMVTIVFFGAENTTQAANYIKGIVSLSLFSAPEVPDKGKALIIFCFICVLLFVEWLQQEKEHELQVDAISPSFLRTSIYYFLILAILCFGSVSNMNFIYSQF